MTNFQADEWLHQEYNLLLPKQLTKCRSRLGQNGVEMMR